MGSHYRGLYPLHQMGAFYLLEMSFFSTGWRKVLLTSWDLVTVCNTCTQTLAQHLAVQTSHKCSFHTTRGHRRKNNAGAKDPA